MVLYVFNPEHDYALANNDPHFRPPASAVRFADECALFLSHLMPDDGVILLPYRERAPYYHTGTRQFSDTPGAVERIVPWGWDALVLRQCRERLPDLVPEASHVQQLRELAHRRHTIDAMAYLRRHCPDLEMPPGATLLHTAQEVERYLQQHREVIFKSPYSGNGRGNLYAHHGQYTPTLARQTTGVLRRQGALLGEPLHHVVQDFAMEFRCHHGRTTFAGYSLFSTKHYGYAGNLLCSDTSIERKLSQWISSETLHHLRDTLCDYLQMHIAGHYDGFLGVDMFIYEEEGLFKVNPMVEINLRMTMGMAAHILCERHLHPDAIGTMRLEYNPTPGALQQLVADNTHIRYEDGRWLEGTLALTPVQEQTQYAIIVNVERRQLYSGNDFINAFEDFVI